MMAPTARAPSSHQSQEGAPPVWASAPAVGCCVVVDGDGAADEPGAVGVGCGTTVAVTVAVGGVLVCVGLVLVSDGGVGVEVVTGDEDALADGFPRVGVVDLFSVRVGAGCSEVAVDEAVVVRDRDTVGAVVEPSPPQEATSTMARPMTAVREPRVSAALGTCRCLVVIMVALLVARTRPHVHGCVKVAQRWAGRPCSARSQGLHRSPGHRLVLSGGVLRASWPLKTHLPAPRRDTARSCASPVLATERRLSPRPESLRPLRPG